MALHGATWGFSRTTVNVAVDRVKYFDQIAGGKRYKYPPDLAPFQTGVVSD